MLYYRASPRDHQSELRTKVSDDIYTILVDLADAEGVTLYEMTRRLVLSALAERAPLLNGRPKSDGKASDFGTVRGAHHGEAACP